MTRVAVLMGGPSAERAISLETGRAVAAALGRLGHEVIEIDVDRRVSTRLLEADPDKAFICLHGALGEDGCVQGLLEVLGIPYTGSGVLASSVAMDKIMTKRLLAQAGIPTPDWKIATERDLRGAIDLPFDYPVVVKPNKQGSTIGTFKVDHPSRLNDSLRRSLAFDEVALIERFIPGDEVTVAIVDGKALPVIGIRPHGGFFDYEAKYTKGETDYTVPAPISAERARTCTEYALRVWSVLGCEGVARVDIRIDPRGHCFVLELNTIPGMTETSLVPMAAAHVGMDFDALCARILESARVENAKSREGREGRRDAAAGTSGGEGR